MAIGQMNKRITFQMPSVTVDDSGGRITSYSDSFTVWAEVKKTNGVREAEAAITGITGTNDFIIRQSTETDLIDKNWLIRYNEKVFKIHNIEAVSEERFYVKITAKDRAVAVSSSSS